MLRTFVMIFCLLNQQIKPTAGFPQTKNRINYGVLFNHEGILDNASQSWIHTYEIQLPHPDDIVKELMNPLCALLTSNHKTACEHYKGNLRQLGRMRDELKESIKMTTARIIELVKDDRLKPKFDKPRHTRSLLPFVADISSKLFGFATEKQLQTLQSHMQFMTNQSNKITHAFQQQSKQLTSFMTQTDDRITNAVKAIENNNQMIMLFNADYANFEHTVDDLQKHWSTTLQLFAREMLVLTQIEQRYQEIFYGVSTLITHQLSPQLIPVAQLMETIKNVSHILQVQYPEFRVVNTNPNFYYNDVTVIFGYHNDSIYINIPFPIATNSLHYDLFRITTVPVSINESSSHATQLLDLPDYLAVSKNADTFIEVSSKQREQCKGVHQLHCPHLLTETTIADATCASSIYFNDKLMINAKCNFQFLSNGLKTSLMEITPSKVLITNASNIMVTCSQKPVQMIEGCLFCIKHIPCKCSFSIPNHYIAPRLNQCRNKQADTSAIYPVNLALLTGFFSAQDLQAIQGNTTFENPMKVKLPDFQIYKHNFSNEIAKDNSYTLNLNKMISKAKQNSVIYQSLAEPIYAGEWLPSTDSWLDTPYLLSMSAIGISVVLSVAVGVMAYKLRTLTVMVATLTAVKPTSAVDPQTPVNLVWFTTPKLPATPAEYSSCNQTIYFFMIPAIIYSLVFIVYMIHRICKKYNTCHGHGSVLWIHFHSSRSLCFPVINLPQCPSGYNIYTDLDINNLQNFKIKRSGIKFFLQIDWNNAYVQHDMFALKRDIPSEIAMDLIGAIYMNSLRHQTKTTYLTLSHGDLHYNLPQKPMPKKIDTLTNQSDVIAEVPSAPLYPQIDSI